MQMRRGRDGSCLMVLVVAVSLSAGVIVASAATCAPRSERSAAPAAAGGDEPPLLLAQAATPTATATPTVTRTARPPDAACMSGKTITSPASAQALPGGKISIKVTVEVPRAVDDVARAIDAQSWDECGRLFKSTYLAQAVDGTYPTPGGWALPATPQPPGSDYGAVLYEFWSCWSKPRCNAWFMNLLDIDAVRTPATGALQRYDVGYRLRTCIDAATSSGPTALTGDNGHLIATRVDGGHTSVSMTKSLAFTSDTDGFRTYAAYVGAPTQVADSIAEIACCIVP
jgi:hypothetical protein